MEDQLILRAPNQQKTGEAKKLRHKNTKEEEEGEIFNLSTLSVYDNYSNINVTSSIRIEHEP